MDRVRITILHIHPIRWRLLITILSMKGGGDIKSMILHRILIVGLLPVHQTWFSWWSVQTICPAESIKTNMMSWTILSVRFYLIRLVLIFLLLRFLPWVVHWVQKMNWLKIIIVIFLQLLILMHKMDTLFISPMFIQGWIQILIFMMIYIWMCRDMKELLTYGMVLSYNYLPVIANHLLWLPIRKIEVTFQKTMIF